ncbi:hypothetical protein P154DRAFT_126088 [Amniculicola lignicola CBS 123094]|uniref:Uncharacterized protein n=1 Tax=Amniculicola lignicola CBS 123094 TaxID=1392246 RepID=A0A6A5WLR4_9PLEO|nr:hypothetical protein P154DRAFT_126088 [Amniculicola lignicola CBS 123094]
MVYHRRVVFISSGGVGSFGLRRIISTGLCLLSVCWDETTRSLLWDLGSISLSSFRCMRIYLHGVGAILEAFLDMLFLGCSFLWRYS